MNKNRPNSMLRKVLVIITFLLIITCLIICIIINNNKNDNYVREWNQGESHIGNISYWDNNGDRLSDGLIRIGNNYWHRNELDKSKGNEKFGDLIFLYSYYINDKTNKYYGEEASMYIYNIDQKLQSNGLQREQFYKNLYDSYVNDTASIVKPTTLFSPFFALSSGSSAVFSTSGEDANTTFINRFIIFANDRIYSIHFANSEWHYDFDDAFDLFDERCISIVNSIDLMSYHKWEIDYAKYKDQLSHSYFRARVVFFVIFLLGIALLFLAIGKIGNNNVKARKVAFYGIICYLINLLIFVIQSLNDPFAGDTTGVIIFCLLPTIMINSVLVYFLAKRSREDYFDYYLIPQKLLSYLKLDTIFKKRLLMIFLIIPLFFVVPFPYFGFFSFVFYILPVLLILAIIWVISYVREGKKIDSMNNIHYDRARIYCRHCGKLIDADSDYCRYCGKKL